MKVAAPSTNRGQVVAGCGRIGFDDVCDDGCFAPAITPWGGEIESLAVSAGNGPTRLYTAVENGGVFRTDDAGATPWIACGASLIRQVSVSPTDALTVYGHDEASGFASTDGCATWTPLSS